MKEGLWRDWEHAILIFQYQNIKSEYLRTSLKKKGKQMLGQDFKLYLYEKKKKKN